MTSFYIKIIYPNGIEYTHDCGHKTLEEAIDYAVITRDQLDVLWENSRCKPRVVVQSRWSFERDYYDCHDDA